MSIMANNDGPEIELCPTGLQQAVLAFVVDLGIQTETFKDHTKDVHQVLWLWELAAKRKTGDFAGQPFQMAQTYTLSLRENSNLSKSIESWTAREIPKETRKSGIDIEKFKGMNAMLNISKYTKGNGFEARKIVAILPMHQSMVNIPITIARPEWIDKRAAQGRFDIQNPIVQNATAPYQVDPIPNEDGLPF